MPSSTREKCTDRLESQRDCDAPGRVDLCWVDVDQFRKRGRGGVRGHEALLGRAVSDLELDARDVFAQLGCAVGACQFGKQLLIVAAEVQRATDNFTLIASAGGGPLVVDLVAGDVSRDTDRPGAACPARPAPASTVEAAPAGRRGATRRSPHLLPLTTSRSPKSRKPRTATR